MARYDREILLALEHESDQRAEPAVAEHHYRLIAREMSLLENLVRRRERLDEHRNIVGDRIGNWNQVDVWESKEFREGAVAPEDSEHCAIGAMARETGGARRASAASGIDLADDASPTEGGALRFDDAAREFM